MKNDKGLALITGASQGLGASIALELAKEGYAVLLAARSPDTLRKATEEAGALNGGRSFSLVLDVLAVDAAEQLREAVLRTGIPLTCLVNNAGQGLYGLFSDLPVEDQIRMMHLNMEAPVRVTHALLPLLRKAPRSHILNIASMTAYGAIATLAGYSGSKAFIWRWSRSLRIELAKTPVSVTCVCPGSILTGFTERAGMQVMDDLAKKFGTGPEPVARTAVRAMLKGKAESIPGAANWITAKLQQLLPAGPVERIASGIYLKRLPKR